MKNKQLSYTVTFVLIIISIVIISGCSISSPEVVCNKPYIKVGTSCCLDQNDNKICDDDEIRQKIEEPEIRVTEPSEKKSKPQQETLTPPSGYTDDRHVPRTISQTTPEWELKPSFFWSTPYYSEPAIKGYWVSIDSLTNWTLVRPPTGKSWTSPTSIEDGTHTFRVRAEYGNGNFGEPGSIYFTTDSKFPDITIEEITWEESTLYRPGTNPLYEIMVSAVIKNDANKDFIGANNLPVTAIAIYLHVDGAWKTTANSLQELFAGEEKKITFKRIYLTEGEHELEVLVDQSDSIKESDETNNEMTVTIDVGAS